MAHYSVHNISEMRGAFRLDAEFWLPEYELVEKAITSVSYVTLGELATDVRKGIFYILASEYTDSGVPFYRSSNVGEILMKETGLAFISEEKDKAEAKTSLKSGDIVLAKTGKEAAAIVTVEKCNISQDVVGIRLVDGAINPFFLVAFLNSKPGILQMRRWFQGQVQMHLTLPDTKRILVPLLPSAFQRKVEKAIRSALYFQEKSTKLYAQAEELLLTELGFFELDLSPTLFYERDFSETQQVARLDAEFFQPAYQKVVDICSAYSKGAETLETLLESMTNGVECRKFVEEGTPYIRVGDMGKLRIRSHDAVRISATEADRFSSKINLIKGDVLTARSGSIGQACVVIKSNDDSIISSHLMRLRLRKDCSLMSDCLALFLSTTPGILQVIKNGNGGIVPEISQPFMKRIVVPILDKIIQEQISDLIQSSHQAEDKSRCLLDDAKRIVEEAVLRGKG